MPQIDPCEWLLCLKQQMGEAHPPVVVIDDGDIALAVQLLKMGAADYLVRQQITPDSLILSLNTAIEQAALGQVRQQDEQRSDLPAAKPKDGFVASWHDITDRKRLELVLNQMQDALQTSQQGYRALADAMPQMVWTTDAAGAITYCNQRWYQYTGLVTADMDGWGCPQIHHPDHVDRVAKRFRQCIESGQTWEDTFPLRGQDGQYRWFLTRAVPIRDPQGNILQWFGTNTDITNLRQTETALKQTTQRLNVALKSAPLTLFNQDLELRYTWIYNPTQNFTVNEVLGKRDVDLNSPETAAHLTRLKQQVLDTGVGLREEVKVTKDDKTWYYDLTIDPIWDGQHTLVGVTCAAVDISDRTRLEIERQQTEDALRQSEDRLRMAIESARLGTWDYNPATQTLTWDAGCRAMFGLSPEADISLERFFEGLHPDERDRLRQLIQWALNPASGGHFDVEYRIVGLDDSVERWIAAKGQAYFDADGAPHRFIGTVLDITERKYAEAQRERLLQRERTARAEAERANRVKDEFLAILSHELRSPLNPILGWAKLLQTHSLSPAKTTEALATIERNAKLQTQLIDDLLDLARILRGKLHLDNTPVRLDSVIEAALDTVRTAATAKSIVLHPALSPMVQVSGDAARLQQIVWNLLSNAIKFTPKQGRVEIRLEAVDDQVQITVKDSGKGISPDFLPHIFESFRQEDVSTTRAHGGLGLGLAIVRQLVEAHGGTIAADSPGEGLGATFSVQLPLLATESVAQPVPQGMAHLPDLTGIRVLTVDDDPDARELLTVLLTQHGAEVLTVASAADVLAQLATFQPDVLVSDIGMPDLDGFALIQKIRALPPEAGGQIPAVALTAYARGTDQQRALASGYQRHIAKPLDIQQMVHEIATLAPSKSP